MKGWNSAGLRGDNGAKIRGGPKYQDAFCEIYTCSSLGILMRGTHRRESRKCAQVTKCQRAECPAIDRGQYA